ncbi:MAG: alpha/beta hydrolase, partial [Acidobacteriota bacterium]
VGSKKSTNGRSWLSVPALALSSARVAFKGLSLIAPGPAAWLARELFLTPQRHQPPLRETWWQTEAERFGLPFEGRELAAWRWGWGGPTILLVHGWAGRGLQLGAFAEPLVQAGYQVVAFDGPGHGESPGRQTNLPEFARAIAAATKTLGGVDAIVAHSFGAGSTLVSMAYEAPKVERLVFVAPPGRLRTITATFEQATGFSADVLDRMRRSIERRFGLSWSDLDPHELAARVEPRHRTLVVHDRQDREIPWSDALDLATQLPSAELRTTEGLGHRRILRDPAVVAAVVDFLGPGDSV